MVYQLLNCIVMYIEFLQHRLGHYVTLRVLRQHVLILLFAGGDIFNLSLNPGSPLLRHLVGL